MTIDYSDKKPFVRIKLNRCTSWVFSSAVPPGITMFEIVDRDITIIRLVVQGKMWIL